MEINYEPCIFDVTNLSNFSEQEEYIMLPFTFLKLTDIHIDSSNYNAYIKFNIIGKKEILEYKIKKSKKIEYDSELKIIK